MRERNGAAICTKQLGEKLSASIGAVKVDFPATLGQFDCRSRPWIRWDFAEIVGILTAGSITRLEPFHGGILSLRVHRYLEQS